MNNKISNAQLAQLLASRSGLELKVCEAYLTELFSVVSQALRRGENVKITGFGTFKLNHVEDRRSSGVSTGGTPTVTSGHVKVVFMPAKELVALANVPFAMFEAVELAETLTVGELSALNETGGSAGTTEEAESPDVADSIDNSEDSDLSDDAEFADKPERAESIESAGESEVTDSPDNSDNPESRLPVKYVYPDREVEAMGRRKFSYGFMVGFISAVLAIGAIVGCYWYFYHNVEEEEAEVKAENEFVEASSVPLDTLNVADSAVLTDTPVAETAPVTEKVQAPQAEQVATAPSDATVYDTVTKTRYLTTIAKEHYGSYHFWPYIYEENKSRLGHPDRIRPGTRVVVPSLLKYGVSPSRPADVEAAKRLGAQIYARFK